LAIVAVEEEEPVNENFEYDQQDKTINTNIGDNNVSGSETAANFIGSAYTV
jgi:hypothetical protein